MADDAHVWRADVLHDRGRRAEYNQLMKATEQAHTVAENALIARGWGPFVVVARQAQQNSATEAPFLRSATNILRKETSSAPVRRVRVEVFLPADFFADFCLVPLDLAEPLDPADSALASILLASSTIFFSWLSSRVDKDICSSLATGSDQFDIKSD